MQLRSRDPEMLGPSLDLNLSTLPSSGGRSQDWGLQDHTTWMHAKDRDPHLWVAGTVHSTLPLHFSPFMSVFLQKKTHRESVKCFAKKYKFVPSWILGYRFIFYF
jgi:hypothetical protein